MQIKVDNSIPDPPVPEHVRLEAEQRDRLAKEYWDERWREARRTAPRRYGPAVDGVIWRGVRPGEETSQGPPILSILQFPLRPDVELDDPAAPARALWDVTAQYVASVPGCEGLEWGTATGTEDTPAGRVVCWVRWDSVAAWRRFQWSLGFSPVVGPLAADCSNRCAKVVGGGVPRFGDEGETVVDVVSVVFDAGDVATAEQREAVGERWGAVMGSVKDRGLRSSYTIWLEDNASTFAEPTPEEIAEGLTSTVFMAFIAWDGAGYDSQLADELRANLQATLVPPNASNEPVISSKAVRLIKHTRPQYSLLIQNVLPARPFNSLAKVLQPNPTRHCSADIGNVQSRGGEALDKSIQDARYRARLFPAPRGDFVRQGEFFEGNIRPWQSEHHLVVGSAYHVVRSRSSLGPADECQFVDVVWMRLRTGDLSETRGSRARRELIIAISGLPGLVKAHGALDVDDKKKVAVAIVWANEAAWEAAREEFRRVLDDFTGSSIDLAAPVTYEIMPILFRCDHGSGRSALESTKFLEWTRFHIPPGELARRLFEYAYAQFERMLSPSDIAGIPTACAITTSGWWQPAEDSDGPQTFTMAMRWDSPAARLEWYEELFRLSRDSYELFGRTLDALKTASPGGVTTGFLALQPRWVDG